MSIPKEPRQLMINIMYLVLTALLALNVSAEIFNAFEMVDGGLKTANKSLDASNDGLPALIKEGAKKKASLAKYAERVDPSRQISKEGSLYVTELFDKLIDASGDNSGSVDEGDYAMDGNKRIFRGQRDYAGPTRIMVDEGEGEVLKERMLKIKEDLLALIDEEDRDEVAANMPIAIDDEAWQNANSPKKNWSDFTFGHMPLGATQPIFTKFVNDIKASESAVLNYLAGKVGTTTDIVLEKYAVVSAPKKAYIIKGEPYEADIFLSAAAGSDSNTGISISVGGQRLKTDAEGNAKYRTTPSSTGTKNYTASISVTNPSTGEVKTYKKNFEFEVGERSVAVSASKMNVFYIGVDNPVEVTAAGVSSNDIKVSMGGSGGGTIKKKGDGTYNVRVSTPTNKGQFAKVNISAGGLSDSKNFRVKRIPDPVPVMGKDKRGGVMGNGEFKAYSGLRAELLGFDFDAKCEIKGFQLVRAAKREDAQRAINPGGKYKADAKRLVDKAKPSDTYYFENIKCSCPGDKGPRDLGQMVVKIK